MRRLIFSLASLLLFVLPAPAKDTPRAVVLVISDGTSLELLTAARMYAKGGHGRLELESMPRTAIVRTVSRSDLVTDSAAAATAIARGIKADNRVVGQETAKADSGPASLLDVAREAGWSTGVVSDDQVTGATPAAFIVEHRDRDEFAEIAAKEVAQLGKRVDVLLGGGRKWVAVSDDETYKEGEKEIARRNEAVLKSGTIAWFDDWGAFQSFAKSGGDGRPVFGTFAPEDLPFYVDGKRELRLVDMVEAAVGLLEARGKPFFLMVEAGAPDTACHMNNAKRAVTEVLELDATVAWLRKHLPPDSLLLVTTDHNTGGLAINGQPMRGEAKGDELLRANPVNEEMFFTWSSGPGATSANENLEQTDPAFTQPALLPRKSAMHTGGDVWLLGEGPGGEAVVGFLDNTDVFRIARDAIQRK